MFYSFYSNVFEIKKNEIRCVKLFIAQRLDNLQFLSYMFKSSHGRMAYISIMSSRAVVM